MRRAALFALVAVFTLAACGGEPVPVDDLGTTTVAGVVESNEGDGETMKPIPPLSTGRTYGADDYPSELTRYIETAAADLAERLGIESPTSTVSAVEEVVWSDSSLGCPQPGMAYTQVPVDGLRIVLVHEGVQYPYHSGGFSEPFLCAPRAEKESVSPETDSTQPPATDPATGLETEKPPIITPPVEETEPTQKPGGPGDPDV